MDLSKVPRDPDQAVRFIVSYLLKNQNYFYIGTEFKKTKINDLQKLIELLRIAGKKAKLGPNIAKNIEKIARLEVNPAIFNVLKELQQQIGLVDLHSHFNENQNEPKFLLNESETKRIAALASEMKGIVNESEIFTEHHKRRLISRISQVEIEVHKKNGRFDVILGGVVDFGEVLGQFGKSVKPLVDRMTEIRGIAQKKTPEYEKLPAPDEPKKLPKS